MRFCRLASPLALCLLLAACGGGEKNTSSTTSAAPGAPPPTAPLTGLPETDEESRSRPLLTVKVDNHPLARPHFGLDQADVIVEEKVEGGVSRLMVLFQSKEVERAGPVRSVRSTDVAWLKPVGGMLAYSGGIPEVKRLLGPTSIVDLGADNHGAKYYKRRNDRPFEHSMYAVVPALRELTPKSARAPKPLFRYRGRGEAFAGAGIAPVTAVEGRMGTEPSATRFAWNWNAASGAFVRTTDGQPHAVEGSGQVAVPNVIIQFTPYRATPWRDRSGSVVDEAVVTGTGDAWILSDGKVVPGKWSRPSDTDVTTFTDSTGAPGKLAPGRTWLSLVPAGVQVTKQ